ncbi:inorganic pyrophosphatase [Brumimicrobium aurantiacum]|uniref:Inorganic pyrophosphatase n=1 Tax=Brumimicrobium aurantiacum TaxID=1737063 RepID=A0A3E1EVB5_9FLAO|nr:inorganic pyrophosphatase [Brumimicrobium aurantiacum]RFC53423.1 inorganic pyrophosphatase [Brumimicrobium aurantiacum]
MKEEVSKLTQALKQRFVSHPWHGINIGEKQPELINTFIEIVPSDAIKYEVDKDSGYLMVDRPQKFSNHMPCMYGFVPQTLCDKHVAEYANEKTGRTNIVGDDDPLDICVLSEREVNCGNIIAEAIPIGGFRMIDGGEADDKIIAVLKDDQFYGDMTSIDEVPQKVLDRVQHFFLTYKDLGGASKKVEITHTYGADEAKEVIRRSALDYKEKHGDADDTLAEALASFLKEKV